MISATLTGHTIEDLALRWFCSRDTAWTLIYEPGGFLDRGFMEKERDRLVVTKLGVRISHVVGAMQP